MAKFHIDVNGAPAACTAKTRACPRGGEEEHGASAQEVLEKFEAKQADKTMPKAVKKAAKRSLPKEALRRIATAETELEAEMALRARVMATVQNELDAISLRAEAQREERKAAIQVIFDAATVEDFADKTTAASLYNLGWSSGSGHAGFMDLERRVLGKSQLSFAGWNNVDGDNPVKSLAIHTDDDVDDERLDRTAELMEKFYPAQQALYPEIKIEVYTNASDVMVTRDAKGGDWEVIEVGYSGPEFSSPKARDVLDYLNRESAAYSPWDV